MFLRSRKLRPMSATCRFLPKKLFSFRPLDLYKQWKLSTKLSDSFLFSFKFPKLGFPSQIYFVIGKEIVLWTFRMPLMPWKSNFPKSWTWTVMSRFGCCHFLFIYFNLRNLIGSRLKIINPIGRLKKINKKQQQPNVDIVDYVQLLGRLDF